jgi:hypothetical protein
MSAAPATHARTAVAPKLGLEDSGAGEQLTTSHMSKFLNFGNFCRRVVAFQVSKYSLPA